MRIVSVRATGNALFVECEGFFGIGSRGTPSATLIVETCRGWIQSHPDRDITHLCVDFRKVDYTWGDGPAALGASAYKLGIRNVTIRPGRENKDALKEVISALGMEQIVYVPDPSHCQVGE